MRIGGFLIGVVAATALLSVVLDVPELGGLRTLMSGLTAHSVAVSSEAERVEPANSVSIHREMSADPLSSERLSGVDQPHLAPGARSALVS